MVEGATRKWSLKISSFTHSKSQYVGGSSNVEDEVTKNYIRNQNREPSSKHNK